MQHTVFISGSQQKFLASSAQLPKKSVQLPVEEELLVVVFTVVVVVAVVVALVVPSALLQLKQ